ncbi:MAG: hypothetical protein Q4P72_01515 [Eubacteriales bacterium]|nr:hypothetical protein [Eubacteriales bacterium]
MSDAMHPISITSAASESQPRANSKPTEQFQLPRLCLTGLSGDCGQNSLCELLAAAFRIHFVETSTHPSGSQQYGQNLRIFEVYEDPDRRQRLEFICGQSAISLDPWIQDREMLLYSLYRYSFALRLALISGRGSLFDSELYSANSSSDASASPVTASPEALARCLETPIILIVDASEMRSQLLPLIRACLDYAEPSLVQGLILTRVEEEDYSPLKSYLEAELKLPVFGYMSLEVERSWRHACRRADWRASLQELAEALFESLELEGLLKLAEASAALEKRIPESILQLQHQYGSRTSSLRIAYADDPAFDLSYRENLDAFADLGIELIPFSPLYDAELPREIDGIYLSSNRIKSYLPELSQRRDMRRQIYQAVDRGCPLLADSEAYLFLCRHIYASDDVNAWPMLALLEQDFSLRTQMSSAARNEIYVEWICLTQSAAARYQYRARARLNKQLIPERGSGDFQLRLVQSREQFACLGGDEGFTAIPARLYLRAHPRHLRCFIDSCFDYRKQRQADELQESTQVYDFQKSSRGLA